MKKMLPILILLFIVGCNSAQDDSSEEISGITDTAEKEDPVFEEEIDQMESFYENWHVAFYKSDSWWYMKGCPDYAVYIEDIGRDKEYGRITLGDRLGMSVWLKAAIEQINIESNGKFQFACIDEYAADRKFTLSGKIIKDHKIWETTVINLNEGYISEQLIEELGDGTEVDSINLFLPKEVVKFPIKVDEAEGCP